MQTLKPPRKADPFQPARSSNRTSASPAWIIGLVGVVAILLFLFVLVS